MATMVTLEEAFHVASSKFRITDLNDYQELAVRKTVLNKDDTVLSFLSHGEWPTFSHVVPRIKH